MIVSIKDRATLLGIHPARVGAYLHAKGWQRMVHEPSRYSLWVKPDAREVEALLPLDSGLGDFAERMAELLGDLQREEQRSELEILRDIELANCDVFRFRKDPHSDIMGTIQIDDGVRFVAHARDLLLYAAAAEHEPSRTAVTRPSADVSRFMSQALLGQTEISSFVVTAQVPVPSRLSDPLFPDLISPALEPFERRAGVRLMSLLSDTREAAMEVAQTNDFRPFAEVLNRGATVDLYSTLVEAQEIGPGEPLEIGCSWAPARPLVGSAPLVVRFEPELTLPIRSAVDMLRPRSVKEGVRIFGYVELLQQPAQEVLVGELVVKAVVERSDLNVHLTLSQPDYGLAIKAFGEKRPIEVVGDLAKDGKFWRLRDPRNIVLHRGENAPSSEDDDGE